MYNDVALVDLRLEDGKFAGNKLVTLLHHGLVVKLANHRCVLVLACCVEDHRWSHRRIDVKVVENLTVASGVDPGEVQGGLRAFCLLTYVFKPCDPLPMILLLVVDLQESDKKALTP